MIDVKDTTSGCQIQSGFDRIPHADMTGLSATCPGCLRKHTTADILACQLCGTLPLSPAGGLAPPSSSHSHQPVQPQALLRAHLPTIAHRVRPHCRHLLALVPWPCRAECCFSFLNKLTHQAHRSSSPAWSGQRTAEAAEAEEADEEADVRVHDAEGQHRQPLCISACRTHDCLGRCAPLSQH